MLHCSTGVARQQYFRCGMAVAQGTVWPPRVVVATPLLDDDLLQFSLRFRVTFQ